jgi:hypothetical protein
MVSVLTVAEQDKPPSMLCCAICYLATVDVETEAEKLSGRTLEILPTHATRRELQLGSISGRPPIGPTSYVVFVSTDVKATAVSLFDTPVYHITHETSSRPTSARLEASARESRLFVAL